jgi:SAM-dependent methyltransferase
MPDDRWLAAVWPFVCAQLPPAPAAVAEIGCGPLGGFVPVLRSAGYAAVGIDPEAPEGPWYRQAEFEDYATGPVAAIIACTSLHHVADLSDVLDRVQAALAPGGVVVVVEWARERFDEATARWSGPAAPAGARCRVAQPAVLGVARIRTSLAGVHPQLGGVGEPA